MSSNIYKSTPGVALLLYSFTKLLVYIKVKFTSCQNILLVHV